MIIFPPFAAWSAKAVESRLIEAAETLMLCPRVSGPKQFGSAMPEPVRLQIDAYASNERRYQRKPDAAAIDRMEECWGWINGLPEQHKRCLVYDWTYTKIDRRRSLRNLAIREGFTDRTLRREILRLCSDIAGNLNRAHKPNLASVQTSQIDAGLSGKCNSSYQNHWRAANARPPINPKLKKTRHV